MRIAGIDREISTLEILWAQASEEERVKLASGLLTSYYDAAGQDIELSVDTDRGVYVITVARKQAEKEKS